uniref:S6-ribonuclease n=1 Tax=Citrus maxima TaxID=37334 RepID=A0A6B9KTF9_CITMA|nr:S6-ribonuclease [Citrus maxima]
MGTNFLIIFVQFVSCIASGAAQNASGFDHFWLVLSWPPVYCLQNPCNNPPFDFSLHGLWPVNSSGHTLKNSSHTFKNFQKKIEHLPFRGELKKYWPSLASSDPTNFWKHEWDEHGSGQPSEPPDYFLAAITLRKNVDLLSTLRRYRIVPGGTSYPITDYVKATKDIYGYPRLTCVNRYLLKEVNLCVDRQARNFISCNHRERGSTTCGKNIKLPRYVKI